VYVSCDEKIVKSKKENVEFGRGESSLYRRILEGEVG